MKRTALILGIAAAMGVFAPVAAGARSQSEDPIKAARVARPGLILQTERNSRTGQVMYRIGNSGLWME